MEAPISHESRASTLYAVMGVFFPIAFTAVSLRLYSRIKYSYIGIDDVLIILALVCHPSPHLLGSATRFSNFDGEADAFSSQLLLIGFVITTCIGAFGHFDALSSQTNSPQPSSTEWQATSGMSSPRTG